MEWDNHVKAFTSKIPHQGCNFANTYIMNQFEDIPDEIFDLAVDNWFSNQMNTKVTDLKIP